MKFVKFVKFELSDEIKRLAQQIDNPQDLDEALLSTAYENVRDKISDRASELFLSAVLGVEVKINPTLPADAAVLCSPEGAFVILPRL